MAWPVSGCATLPAKASSPSSVSRSAPSRTGTPSAESLRPAIWFSRSRGIFEMIVCSPSDIAATLPQYVAGDDHPLHLGGPLPDLAQLRVAVVALDREVLGV